MTWCRRVRLFRGLEASPNCAAGPVVGDHLVDGEAVVGGARDARLQKSAMTAVFSSVRTSTWARREKSSTSEWT
jgi:hypothetical protein